MAITAVTGLPGHGKTLFTIARWKAISEQDGRPVFYSGIKGLTLPWQEWETERWQELPPHSIFIIDEAQFRLKVHGRGQLPDWIEKLSVHRHGGLDIVVLTQNPMMLDPFVRRLVDVHFHVVRKFGMQRATVHEFPTGINDNVAKVRKGSIRHDWKYPVEAYSWYQSAEVHTVKRRIPMRIWIGLAFVVLFCIAATWGFLRMRPSEIAAPVQSGQRHLGQGSGVAPAAELGGRVGDRQHMTAAEYVESYQPRIQGLPHTAPVYDGVTAPQQAPYPAACIASTKRCQCYTQQGTRMDMAEQLCRQLADGGFFVAWAPNGERVQSAQAAAPAAQGTGPAVQGTGSAGFGPSAPIFTAQASDPDAGSLPRRVRRIAQ